MIKERENRAMENLSNEVRLPWILNHDDNLYNVRFLEDSRRPRCGEGFWRRRPRRRRRRRRRRCPRRSRRSSRRGTEGWLRYCTLYTLKPAHPETCTQKLHPCSCTPAPCHTVHIAPYFRGLPPNRGFSAKMPPECPIKLLEPPIFLEPVRFDNKKCLFMPCCPHFFLHFFLCYLHDVMAVSISLKKLSYHFI